MNLTRWTLLSGGIGALAMCAVALQTLTTPHLYSLTVGALGCTSVIVQGVLLPPPLKHEQLAWVVYGLIGALGGTVVLLVADWYLDDLLGGAGFGFVVGTMGWAIIRDSVKGAWRWVLLNTAAYALVSVVVLLTKTVHRLYTAYDAEAPPALLAAMLTAGALSCAWVVGFGMLRLLYTDGKLDLQT